MTEGAEKKELIRGLQQQILALQGCRSALDNDSRITCPVALARAFPQNTFPLGAVHEFLSYSSPDTAATNGFITGLIGQLAAQSGTCLWISTRRSLFPPALKNYGIDPDRVIFINLKEQKHTLWTMEEALKCDGLAAVVGELSEIGFTASRRLQLAVESSRVTGFIHRYQPRVENNTACVTRWKITSIPSFAEDMLGVGFPRWQVQLLKVRNGKPGSWQMEWTAQGLQQVITRQAPMGILTRKTG